MTVSAAVDRRSKASGTAEKPSEVGRYESGPVVAESMGFSRPFFSSRRRKEG